MRILIHDYSGHPFQVQLSRHLAARGHRVRHAYSAAVETPRGPLAQQPGDPAGFEVAALATDRTLAKYRIGRRMAQELAYARELAQEIRRFRPDTVLSGNANPVVQRVAAAAAHRLGAGFVYWLQDLYAPALQDALRGRSATAARLAGPPGRRVESGALAASDGVVAISAAFAEAAAAAGVPSERIHTIPNWAPPLDLPQDDGAAWRAAHGLEGRFVALYAGTLGQKHDSEALAALARHWRSDPDAAVVVASQGPGRAHLEQVREQEDLTNLHLMDFRSYAELPTALRAADVLLALLSPAGSGYAVPSKVLTGLRSGRPLLAAMPADNPASRTMTEANAGLVVPPDDHAAWCTAADDLRADPALRARLGANGAAWAEHAFAIEAIGARFLDALGAARSDVRGRRRMLRHRAA